MTHVADFLLQPATTRAGERMTEPAGADRKSSPTSGQDFSRLLVQQRQAAVQPRPAPQPAREVARKEPAQPAPVRNEAAGRQEPAARQTSPEATTAEQGAVEDGGVVRQKDDVQEQPVTAEAGQDTGMTEDEAAVPPGLLNPLLEQIRQSETVAVETGEEPDAAVEGAAVVQNVLAMIEGASAYPVSASTPATHATASAASQLLSGQPAQAGSGIMLQQQVGPEVEAEQPEVEGLLPELDPGDDEGVNFASQLLATSTVVRRDGAEQGRAVDAPAVKVAGAGEARTDTLMRSEAVQSAQAARQVPGQPLNMQQPGWSKELTDKVMWMSSQNLKSAEIKMNPAELGRLEIRVQVGQEHTQISFTSAHAGVRDSLDGQMHRLREMLEQQGMHNVDVEVSGQSHQQQEQQAGRGAAQSGAEEVADEQLVATTELDVQQAGHSGLVSQYV